MWKYITKDHCTDFLLSLHLLNYKNKNQYLKTLYTISNNIEDNYKIFKIKKRNGKERTIYAPKRNLKHIQKQILKNILNNKEISKYATAYHKNISLKDNAIPHINKKIILKLDIENFFENIKFENVYNTCFPIEYFPRSLGILLTYLCTYNNHLTQGSPTSAYISNLVMKEFDETIGPWCEKQNISYTRYSDDMTFSGDFNPKIIINEVKKQLNQIGLTINRNKIHVITNNKRQSVTGIVVNKKLNINNQYRKKIRQEIYYIKKYGLDSHMNRINKKEKNKYINSLYGQILFVLQIDTNNKEFIEYKTFINNLKNKEKK